MTRTLGVLALMLATASSLAGQEPVDRTMIARIREEGLQRSQVQPIFTQLTDVIGPRLTGSPSFKQAVDWSAAELKRFGASDVHIESFPFGRGWSAALSRKDPETGSCWAAVSHSNSVGSRAPAQGAKASASK